MDEMRDSNINCKICGDTNHKIKQYCLVKVKVKVKVKDRVEPKLTHTLLVAMQFLH